LQISKNKLQITLPYRIATLVNNVTIVGFYKIDIFLLCQYHTLNTVFTVM